MRSLSPSALILALLSLTALAACDDTPTTVPPPTRSDAGDGSAQAAPDTGEPPLDGGLPSDTGLAPDTGSVTDDAGTPPEDGGVDTDSGVAPAQPVATTPGAWVWTDFPGTACDEGTPTGIGVNASPTGSSNVLIFLNGGGACWDFATCVQLDTSAHGPFGAAQFGQISPFLSAGAFSRVDQANPFRDWTHVFVPYCTGDIHSGSRVAQYSGGGAPVSIHHVGHTNMLAFLARLQATFPAPGKVVLSGASAGGFGTVFNYDDTRATWPAAEMYMVDDSGPSLPGTSYPQALRDAWEASWGMGPLLTRVCGPTCRTDYAQSYAALASRYPDDRFALLSTLQDETIRSYLGLTPAAFEAALRAAARDSIAPTANFEFFLVPGNRHTMLGEPQNFTSSGTNLFTWLQQMVEDDAAWTSTGL